MNTGIQTGLGLIAVSFLFACYGNHTVVWGGLILGIIVGILLTSFVFRDNGFDLSIVAQSAIIGTFCGGLFV